MSKVHNLGHNYRAANHNPGTSHFPVMTAEELREKKEA